MIKVKGYEFKQITIRDSYNRRALQYQNKIINYFKSVGIIEDDVDVAIEGSTVRKVQATVSWYMGNEHLFYSYNGSSKFVENLAMVAQVINHFLNLLKEEEITLEDFNKEFAEDKDIIQQRKDARAVLGVEEHSTDFETMHKNYKKLSKKHHPDMSGGDTERFKSINTAHKILRKELV